MRERAATAPSRATAISASTAADGGYAKVAEAAEYIGVDKATIRVMMSDGRLTPYKLGSRIWRVDLNEIDAVMAAGGAE